MRTKTTKGNGRGGTLNVAEGGWRRDKRKVKRSQKGKALTVKDCLDYRIGHKKGLLWEKRKRIEKTPSEKRCWPWVEKYAQVNWGGLGVGRRLQGRVANGRGENRISGSLKGKTGDKKTNVRSEGSRGGSRIQKTFIEGE